MLRLFRLSILLAFFGILAAGENIAQTPVYMAGRIAPGEVRILVNNPDSLYYINRQVVVAGTMIIEPGTKVYFFPNGRLIDSTGGRIIADGFANAVYNERPDGINPIQPGSRFYSYADPEYFLYESATARTVDVTTVRDLTVHPEKYNHIFNVIIDTMERKVYDLQNPDDLNWPKMPAAPNQFVIPIPGDDNKFIVPFEHALMFHTSRMNGMQYKNDINLNLKPWLRVNDRNVNIVNEQIRFIGQVENNFSREWGHIVILPGARAAFFRNVKFEGFRKDTTVDMFHYENSSFPGMTAQQVKMLNEEFRMLTTGSGGAITTYSARTWLLNCEFENNFARYRGGALQLLQAPDGFPKYLMYEEEIGYYPLEKNPAFRERDDDYSWINRKVLRIDNIDEPTPEPYLGPGEGAFGNFDYYRQAYDDARIAVFLGRMRGLKFSGNKVQIANTIQKRVGGQTIVGDTTYADFPIEYGDMAAGGAVYISGKPGEGGKETQIEIGFGINNSINTIEGTKVFPYKDYFEAVGNQAINFQASRGSDGARGGAVYVSEYTSLIIGGKLKFNETRAPYMEDEMTGANAGLYSMGGAVFHENTLGRLQIIGGPWRDSYSRQYTSGRTLTEETIDNSTEFYKNKSGAGGALFVDGNTDTRPSPIIGGSDVLIKTRDMGFNIRFNENQAIAWGGALFVKRNFFINGAGGVESDQLIGYGGKYPVKFDNNTAGYSGGAIDVRIPNAYSIVSDKQRAVEIVRAAFRENEVGFGIDELNKNQIRGGGAIYSLSADLSIVKGVEFRENLVQNGNGGAIAMIQPMTSAKRFFVTDLDKIFRDQNGIADSYESFNYPFVYDTINSNLRADANMLTRFLENEVTAEDEVMNNENYGNGTGTTQQGKGTDVTSANLKGISFVDHYLGFAVGQFGTIIRFSSTNEGWKWEYKNANPQITLNKVRFATPNIGLIIGKQGVIMRTNNSGHDWNIIEGPSSNEPDYNDLCWVGTQHAFIVGEEGTIRKSIDGGQTWSAPLNTNVIQTLHGVFFTTGSTGYAVGDRGLILKTDDGGLTWTTLISNTLNNLYSIFFTDGVTGYITGQNGTILKTTNGGTTWFTQSSPAIFALQEVKFTNHTHGLIVGDFGTMLRTDDGGDTWSEIDPGTTYSLKDVTFPTNDSGFAVGDFGNLLQTLDGGSTWTRMYPYDMAVIDFVRRHPEIGLPENGVGLGGAIYVLDSMTASRAGRVDSINFNRVRIQKNIAYSGAAVYSDNFDLKFILNRSYITGNIATSDIGLDQNVISGPLWRDDQGVIEQNHASSDLAGAIFYGEIQGPLPSYMSPEAANSIFDNNARFLIRLPDAPNTKGVLAGTTGIGYGGVDTLRGNYWGHTEANVFMEVENIKWIYFINDQGELDSVKNENAQMETFYVDMNRNDPDKYYKNVNLDSTYLGFVFQSTELLEQGPFESPSRYTYQPIPLINADGDQEISGENSIPDKLLMSGYVYDLYDKGTDIKTADYTHRRMSPIEDFAVGIPPLLRKFENVRGDITYVRRWARDPFIADSMDDQGDPVFPIINELQEEFRPDLKGNFYHPIGYPLYLEAYANYDGEAEVTNFDPRAINETVFFVINETTGDFIRANLSQFTNDAKDGIHTDQSMRETFRARIDLVPDSSDYPQLRQKTMRRTLEGLLNLGTGAWLLGNLWHNPTNEDNATLPGRKYHSPSTRLANYENLFSNRPSLPPSQEINDVNYVTYYAGERYNTLPANVGDTVRIISRTVLWREGVVRAFDQGLKFHVTNSTEPPIWTGNIVELQTDTLFQRRPSEFPWENKEGTWRDEKVTAFLNKIFVTEDREYPVPAGTYSNLPLGNGQGRDSILSVTAEDTMRYFDPRSLEIPDEYANLTYRWSVNPISGLARWLMADTVYAEDNEFSDYTNPYYNAKGYLMFRGRPINPFVVPGGEEITVTAENFPPSFRTVDLLKEIGMDDNRIEKFIQLFPSYLNAPSYDIGELNLRARYLQQDTIWNSENYRTQDYKFKIYVVDSVPRYLPHTASTETIMKRVDRYGNEIPYVTYEPSIHKCGLTDDGRLKANLAGDPATGKFKLRFQSDFNSDDEMEDHSPASQGWDFRFGKTAYGFRNTQIRDKGVFDNKDTQDTTIFDTSIVENELGLMDTIVVQTRPSWMKDEYLILFDDDETLDPLAVDFTTFGKLNVRVPGDKALELLTPNEQRNGALNTDTMFTVIITDGHGGVKPISFDVFINVAPEIITESLPPAKEDIRYNPMLVDTMKGINISNMLDSNKMIKVFDPNFGQTHTFELIYEDDPRDEILRDPCYPEAGVWDIRDKKTTPRWLKINRESGLLYGTPGIKDAPRTEQVTVLVKDSDSLTVVKTLTLQVDSTNHGPEILDLPNVICIDEGEPYEATIVVVDKDLMRGREAGDPTETLTIEVLEPSGLEVDPSTVSGIRDNDSVEVKISTNSFSGTPGPDGRVTIKVKVTDASGMEDIKTYKVKYADPTTYIRSVKVENALGAYQYMVYGLASPINSSTGDGSDNQEIGKLDANHCEYEIPPIPYQDVFDARWFVPKTDGILRSIHPENISSEFRAKIQSGGVNGNTAPSYPVIITIFPYPPPEGGVIEDPVEGKWYIRDLASNGNVFNFDIETGEGNSLPSIKSEKSGDTLRVIISGHDIEGFSIFYNAYGTSVDDNPLAGASDIISVSPNPVNNNATIKFNVGTTKPVKLDIIDALGNVAATVKNDVLPLGTNEIQWNCTGSNGIELPSGSYRVRLTTGSEISTYPFVIVK